MKNFLTRFLTGSTAVVTPTAATVTARDAVATFTLGYAGVVNVEVRGSVEFDGVFGNLARETTETEAIDALRRAGFMVGTATERAQATLAAQFGSVEVLGGGYYSTALAKYAVQINLDGVLVTPV